MGGLLQATAMQGSARLFHIALMGAAPMQNVVRAQLYHEEILVDPDHIYRLRFNSANDWQIVYQPPIEHLAVPFLASLQAKKVAEDDGGNFSVLSLQSNLNITNEDLIIANNTLFQWCERSIGKQRLAQMSITPKSRVNIALYFLPVLFNIYEEGGIELHSALIENSTRGTLLIAPSDRGKTTWSRKLPISWNSLSDDCAVLIPSSSTTYQAHPVPSWSRFLFRKHQDGWDVGYATEIKSAFFLEKANNDKIIPMMAEEAAIRLFYNGLPYYRMTINKYFPTRKVELNRRRFENCCKIARSISFFTLKATLAGGFWKELEELL